MGTIWTESGAWPDLIRFMRHVLNPGNAVNEPQQGASRWAELPALCCEAAGGEAGWADDLTLAWLLAFAAADLMDSVQDQDEPEAWWRKDSPGVALATASGLYFSASLALDQLHQHKETSSAANDVVNEFYNAFLVMTSSQLTELIDHRYTLETYWQFAGAKSGAFFRLACRAGGRLATANQDFLEAYGEYGYHLGELIQIKDDLEDVRLLRGLVHSEQKGRIQASLPFVYALSVSSSEEQARLMDYLEVADTNQQAVAELVTLLDQLGASHYVRAEMENKRRSALQALNLTYARQPQKNTLERLIQDL